MPALRILAAALLIAAVNFYDFGTLSASVPRWIVIYIWAVMAFPLLAMRLDAVDWTAISLLLYLVVSWGWSSDRLATLHSLPNATALLVIFMWIRRNPQWVGEAATLAVLITLCLQYFFPWDYGGHGNRNFQSEVMIIGLCLGCRWKWLWWPTAIAVAVYLFAFNPGKIEYFAALALGVWFVSAKLYRFHSVKSGDLA